MFPLAQEIQKSRPEGEKEKDEKAEKDMNENDEKDMNENGKKDTSEKKEKKKRDKKDVKDPAQNYATTSLPTCNAGSGWRGWKSRSNNRDKSWL